MQPFSRCSLAALVGLALIVLTPSPTRAATGSPPEFQAASAAILAGDIPGAAASYEAFLSRAPEDPLASMAHVAAADLVLRARGDTAAALAHCEAAHRGGRASGATGAAWAAEGARRSGELLRARREWASAAASLSDAAAIGSDPASGVPVAWTRDVIVAAADCYYQAGAPEKVIATYEAVLAADPPPEIAGTALYRLGEAHEQSGRLEPAASAYARVLTDYPSSDLFDEALAKRSVIEARIPLEWPVLEAYQAGTAAIARRDLPAALAQTDTVLAVAKEGPLHECAQYRRITLATSLAGDYTEGCRALRAYLDEHPGSPRAAMARTTLEQSWKTVAAMEANLRSHPEDGGLARELAMAYLQNGATQRAIGMLETARAQSPADPEIANGLGYAYARAGRMQDASASFEVYLAANPSDTDALNMIGYSFLAIGQAPKAVEYFERYAKISPDDPNAHDSLGEGYMNAGRLEDAAREYEAAIRLNPDFANSHFMLGTVRERLGDGARAAESMRRFLDLSPNGPQADEARAALQRLDTPHSR